MKTLIRLVGIVVLMCSFLPTAPSAVAQPRQQTAAPLVSQSNVAPNDEWSTPCSPKPWANNPELRALGYEVVNVSFRNKIDWIFSPPDVDRIESTLYNNVKIRIRRLNTNFNAIRLTKEALYPTSDVYIPFTIKQRDSFGITQRYDSQPSHFFLTIYDSSTGLEIPDNQNWDYFKFKHPEDWKSKNNSYLREKDYFINIGIPVAHGNLTVKFYTEPFGTHSQKPAYFSIINTQAADLKTAGMKSHDSTFVNCSSFSKPHPFTKLVSNGNASVQVNRVLSKSEVDELISSLAFSPPPKGMKYVALRLEVHYHMPASSSGLTANIEVIDSKGKIYRPQWSRTDGRNDFVNSAESVTLIYTLPSASIAKTLQLCFECDSYPISMGLPFRHYECCVLSQESGIAASIHGLQYINLDNHNATDHPSRFVSTCDSNSKPLTPKNTIVKVGNDYTTSGYSLCLRTILIGDEAIKYLCIQSNCKGKFLEMIDNFQRKNDVLLAFAHIDLTLAPKGETGDKYGLGHIQLSTAGSPFCTQLKKDVGTYNDKQYYYKTPHDYDCVALSPRQIGDYLFTPFKNAFEYSGIYQAGTKLSGWIRFWVPRKPGPKVLQITPFPNENLNDTPQLTCSKFLSKFKQLHFDYFGCKNMDYLYNYYGNGQHKGRWWSPPAFYWHEPYIPNSVAYFLYQ